MSARRAAPAVALPLAAGILLAAALVGAAQGPGGRVDAFEHAAAAMGVVALVGLSLATRPAWPLSLGLAAAVFSGHWEDLDFPFALDRALLGAGAVSALIREQRRAGTVPTRPLHWLLAIVAAYALISAIAVDTISDSEARFALFDRFSVVAFVLFLVAPFALRTARDRQVLLGTLVALGGYLGLTALIETTGPRALLVPRYIDDPTVGVHFARARGPFTEAVGNGLVLYACGVAAVLAALSWTGRRARGLAGLVAGLCALGVLLTVTRAVWLGAIAGTLLALLAARETRRFLGPAVVVGTLGVLLAFAVIPGLQDRAQRRTDDDRPLWDRRNSNAAALRMVEAKPVLGFGWGTFPTESGDYYRQADDIPLTGVRDVHNVYLANAVELGLIGAALWLFALLWAIGGAITRRGPPALRPWRIGLVAVAGCYLVAAATTPLEFTLPTLLLWTWAGLCWGDDADSPRPRSAGGARAGPSPAR